MSRDSVLVAIGIVFVAGLLSYVYWEQLSWMLGDALFFLWEHHVIEDLPIWVFVRYMT